MAENVFKFIVGQTAEGLNFVLLDKNTGEAEPITSATITITVFQPKSRTELCSGSCSIDDGAAGEFSYTFIEADLNAEGTYEGEIKIVFADSSIAKIQDFYIKVEEAAPT